MSNGRKRGRPPRPLTELEGATLIRLAGRPCLGCGGPRDMIRRRDGVPEWHSRCRKCDNEFRLAEVAEKRLSEWDEETMRIYHDVKWVAKVRPAVKETYYRAELIDLQPEKFVRILELARQGKVEII